MEITMRMLVLAVVGGLLVGCGDEFGETCADVSDLETSVSLDGDAPVLSQTGEDAGEVYSEAYVYQVTAEDCGKKSYGSQSVWTVTADEGMLPTSIEYGVVPEGAWEALAPAPLEAGETYCWALEQNAGGCGFHDWCWVQGEPTSLVDGTERPPCPAK
jgi:hypothetical protein